MSPRRHRICGWPGLGIPAMRSRVSSITRAATTTDRGLPCACDRHRYQTTRAACRSGVAPETRHAVAPVVLREIFLDCQELDREGAARIELEALIDRPLGLAQPGRRRLADGLGDPGER